MHKRTATIALAASLLFASFAWSQLLELGSGENTWIGTLPSGSSIQIKGGLGDIDVVKSQGDAVAVEVKRGTEGSVVPRIGVLQTEKGAVICADWTTPAGQPSQCKEGKGMLASNSLKNYQRVDLRVSVPAGTTVDARANEGTIRVDALNASVNAETYTGGVRVTADGPRVYAGNQRGGTVFIALVPEEMKQKIKADTIAGKVHVVIPPTRLVQYEIYPHGAKVQSEYDLKRDGANFSGSMGPGRSRMWSSLEVYAMDENFAAIEIVKP